MSDPSSNRYADDWNSYSAEWTAEYGGRYRHLGDEWSDDGTAARDLERRLFAHTFEPWLKPNLRVLEIGPGGGKWTVQLAPRVRELVVFDVADAMLGRTRLRVEKEGLTNVTFVLGNGRDLSAIASGSVNVVFSYDVFVHIALEDTVAYLSEIARVLSDNGVVILHHAVNDVPPAWDHIESNNDWYQDRANTRGQYYYHSHAALERMYARFGLRVASMSTSYCTTIVTARKPADSVVPRLEQALRQAATAVDAPALEAAALAIAAVGDDVPARLAPLTAALRESLPGPARYALVQQIRRLIRG